MEVLADGPLTPSEIASRLGVSRAALTGHLRSLRLAGLVEVALDPADTRRHIYTIRPEPLRAAQRMVGRGDPLLGRTTRLVR